MTSKFYSPKASSSLSKSGVIVITHWKQNNYLQANERYTPTIYKRERGIALLLFRTYTNWIPQVYH